MRHITLRIYILLHLDRASGEKRAFIVKTKNSNDGEIKDRGRESIESHEYTEVKQNQHTKRAMKGRAQGSGNGKIELSSRAPFAHPGMPGDRFSPRLLFSSKKTFLPLSLSLSPSDHQ